MSGSDDAKSGDDTGDDTNDVVMENSKSKEKKEPLLICGDRKRDVRNGNATILHCCDYNPVSCWGHLLFGNTNWPHLKEEESSTWQSVHSHFISPNPFFFSTAWHPSVEL